MKFSGKMCFKIILKVTKNQDFTLFLEDSFFKKPQVGRGGGGGGGGGVQIYSKQYCENCVRDILDLFSVFVRNETTIY